MAASIEPLGIWLVYTVPQGDKPALAKFAEDLGYDSVWEGEGRHGDQYSILTGCTLATSRIKLGTSISSVFTRSAPLLAMAGVTVDNFSNGRFIYGLGTDHDYQIGPMHGMVFEKAISRMRDTVEIIRRLVRDDVVCYQGKVIDIERFDFLFDFKAVRREIPVWVAGNFPQMLGVAGEIADGIITQKSLDQIPEALEHIDAGARRAGKSVNDLAVSTNIPCVVADSKEEARHRLRLSRTRPGQFRVPTRSSSGTGWNPLQPPGRFSEEQAAVRQALDEGDRDKAMARISDEWIEVSAITGTPSQCRDKLAEFRAAGITLPILSLSGLDKNEITSTLRALAPRS